MPKFACLLLKTDSKGYIPDDHIRGPQAAAVASSFSTLQKHKRDLSIWCGIIAADECYNSTDHARCIMHQNPNTTSITSQCTANKHLDLQLIYCITASKQGGGYGFMAYPAFRVAPWCSMRSSLSLGSKMLSSQGTPFSNSVARVGFSPMVPPLNSRTPSTAFPSSLAGPPIKPMSPTWACTHRHSKLFSTSKRVVLSRNVISTLQIYIEKCLETANTRFYIVETL